MNDCIDELMNKEIKENWDKWIGYDCSDEWINCWKMNEWMNKWLQWCVNEFRDEWLND